MYNVYVQYIGSLCSDYYGQYDYIDNARDDVCNDPDIAHYQIVDEDGEIVEEDDWED